MGAYDLYPVLLYINEEQEACIRRLFHLNKWTVLLKELSHRSISCLKQLTDDSVTPFIHQIEELHASIANYSDKDPNSAVDYCNQQEFQQHHQIQQEEFHRHQIHEQEFQQHQQTNQQEFHDQHQMHQQDMVEPATYTATSHNNKNADVHVTGITEPGKSFSRETLTSLENSKNEHHRNRDTEVAEGIAPVSVLHYLGTKQTQVDADSGKKQSRECNNIRSVVKNACTRYASELNDARATNDQDPFSGVREELATGNHNSRTIKIVRDTGEYEMTNTSVNFSSCNSSNTNSSDKHLQVIKCDRNIVNSNIDNVECDNNIDCINRNVGAGIAPTSTNNTYLLLGPARFADYEASHTRSPTSSLSPNEIGKIHGNGDNQSSLAVGNNSTQIDIREFEEDRQDSDIEKSDDECSTDSTESNIEDVQSHEPGVRYDNFVKTEELLEDRLPLEESRIIDLEPDNWNRLKSLTHKTREFDAEQSQLQMDSAKESAVQAEHIISESTKPNTQDVKMKAMIDLAGSDETLLDSSATSIQFDKNADEQPESNISIPEQPIDDSEPSPVKIDDTSTHKQEHSWTISPFPAGYRTPSVSRHFTNAKEDEGDREASWVYSPFTREVEWAKLSAKATMCPYCNRIFASDRSLRPHIAEKHPKYAPKYRCHACKVEYKHKLDLTNHKKQTGHVTAAPPTKIICELCGKSFAKKGYDVHILTVHSTERNFYCSVCGKAFKSKGMLQAHENGVHDSKTSTCNVCQKKFKNYRRMLGHRLIHNKKNWRHACKDCDRSFYSKENLEIHQRTHTGEKPFKCHLCTYACTCKQNLHKHLNVHWKQMDCQKDR